MTLQLRTMAFSLALSGLTVLGLGTSATAGAAECPVTDPEPICTNGVLVVIPQVSTVNGLVTGLQLIEQHSNLNPPKITVACDSSDDAGTGSCGRYASGDFHVDHMNIGWCVNACNTYGATAGNIQLISDDNASWCAYVNPQTPQHNWTCQAVWGGDFSASVEAGNLNMGYGGLSGYYSGTLAGS